MKVTILNPIALRMAKTQQNFGCSECSRVNILYLSLSLLYSGPTVLTIKDADKSIATASGAIQVGKYEFVLTVKDAEDLSSTSTLTVNVKKGTSVFQIRRSCDIL